MGVLSTFPCHCFLVRLPDLRSVIVLDGRQPGMFSLEEVMQAGSSRYLQQLRDQQRKLSHDDPIFILFTSVIIPVVTCSGSTSSLRRPLLNDFLTPSLSFALTVLNCLSRAPLVSQRLPRCLILILLTIPICLAKEANMIGG